MIKKSYLGANLPAGEGATMPMEIERLQGDDWQSVYHDQDRPNSDPNRRLKPIEIARAARRLVLIEQRRAQTRQRGGGRVEKPSYARTVAAQQLGYSVQTIATYLNALAMAEARPNLMASFELGDISPRQIILEVGRQRERRNNDHPNSPDESAIRNQNDSDGVGFQFRTLHFRN